MEQLLLNNYIIFISQINNILTIGIYNKITLQYYENDLLNYQNYDDIKNNMLNNDMQFLNNKTNQIQINDIIFNKKAFSITNDIYENLFNDTFNKINELFINYIKNIKIVKLTIHYDERYYLNLNNYYIFNDCYSENTYLTIKNNMFNVNENENTVKYINKFKYFFNKMFLIISNIINCYKISHIVKNYLIENDMDEIKKNLFNDNLFDNNKLFVNECYDIINNLIIYIN